MSPLESLPKLSDDSKFNARALQMCLKVLKTKTLLEKKLEQPHSIPVTSEQAKNTMKDCFKTM